MGAVKKIDPSHPLMDRSVVFNLANGVTNTLQMMAGVSASFEKPFVDVENWKPDTEISVVMSLSADTYSGEVRFHFNRSVAKEIIEKMTGSEIAEGNDQEILDGVGEMSNMFYGEAKTKLNATGFKLSMSIPKPILSPDLPVIAGEFKSMVIPFSISEKSCYVQIIVMLN